MKKTFDIAIILSILLLGSILFYGIIRSAPNKWVDTITIELEPVEIYISELEIVDTMYLIEKKLNDWTGSRADVIPDSLRPDVLYKMAFVEDVLHEETDYTKAYRKTLGNGTILHKVIIYENYYEDTPSITYFKDVEEDILIVLNHQEYYIPKKNVEIRREYGTKNLAVFAGNPDTLSEIAKCILLGEDFYDHLKRIKILLIII